MTYNDDEIQHFEDEDGRNIYIQNNHIYYDNPPELVQQRQPSLLRIIFRNFVLGFLGGWWLGGSIGRHDHRDS